MQYRKRNDRTIYTQKVSGHKLLEWLYTKKCAKPILCLITQSCVISSICGLFSNTFLSKYYIPYFIKSNNIDMSICENISSSFKSFNDFFIRKLKPDARPIDTAPDSVISPADGKILVYPAVDYTDETEPPECLKNIKGKDYTIYNLLQDKELVQNFKKCSVAVIRLSPTDYHRFHFPVSGIAGETREINGKYFSVDPFALSKIPKIFFENKRTVCEVKSQDMSDYLFLEVGATLVGSIKQTHLPHSVVVKGSEKGYFQFGGSTVILIFQQDKVIFDSDLIENSREGIETIIKMGERIGRINIY
ncbi:MAG: archaetidylserine decarboxylase [Candidatus Cloacimonetes bacterium]|nr:archaetidylserine decarboxylase [Candidatus Cloacimonadota bacterium]